MLQMKAQKALNEVNNSPIKTPLITPNCRVRFKINRVKFAQLKLLIIVYDSFLWK